MNGSNPKCGFEWGPRAVTAHGRPSQRVNDRTEVFLCIAYGGEFGPKRPGTHEFVLTVAARVNENKKLETKLFH
jgi:hypothetical protein